MPGRVRVDEPLDRVEEEKSLFQDAFPGRMFAAALEEAGGGADAAARAYLMDVFNKAATTVAAEMHTGAKLTVEVQHDAAGASPIFQKWMGHTKVLAGSTTVTYTQTAEARHLVRKGRGAAAPQDAGEASVELLDVESVAAVSLVRSVPKERQQRAARKGPKGPKVRKAEHEQNVLDVLKNMGLEDDDGSDAGGAGHADGDSDDNFLGFV